MEIYNLDTIDYERIKSKLDNHIENVTNFHEIQPHEIRWHHHVDFVLIMYGVEIELIDTSIFPVVSQGISGRTDIIDNQCIISIVNEPVKGRRCFTLMHEIVHVLLHYEINQFGHFVGKVDMDEKLKEIEADIGASLLMANDDVIDHLISNVASFDSMRDELGYSKKGLHSRLIDYLEFNLDLPKDEAKRIVYEYRGKGTSELYATNEYIKDFKREMHLELVAELSREYSRDYRSNYY